MSDIPKEMRAIALPTYTTPSGYEIATLPTPTITKPDEILIKVHAASINPIDVKVASGAIKILFPLSFPSKLGEDGSGTVVAVGSNVKLFKVGDEVFTRVPTAGYTGFVAEYALSTEGTTALKPRSVSLTEAASIPLASLTAYQALQEGDAKIEGGLKGKTVFIPAGLSGTGNTAVQLAKNVFGAGKVITTLSTGKIEGKKYESYLGEGVVDQVVDYRKEDVIKAVGKGTVDFLLDTVGLATTYAPVLKKGGHIVSFSTAPSGDQTLLFKPDLNFFLKTLLNVMDWYIRWQVGRSSATYEYLFMRADRQNLEDLAKYVDEGKLRPIVGRTAKFENIEEVRKGCQEVYDAKGGVGKFVIEFA